MEYLFTIKYQLSEADSNLDEIVERLGASGCDDALVGMGQPGRIALEFAREADSARAALLSALAAVKQAIPTAKLIEAGPDFVGLTDVAEVTKVSRQNMRKLMVKHARTFPTPVHAGNAAVWHLAPILVWLRENVRYELEQSVVDVAETAMKINMAKEARQLGSRDRRELRELVA
jgi:predicted DNA-binding transcriptional regulator AlpA